MILKLKGVIEMGGANLASILFVTICLFTSTVSATQTCRSDLSASTPAVRYIFNDDGTVVDTVTQLVWKRCSEGLSGKNCESGKASTLTWTEAVTVAATSKFSGKNDWRVPTIQELDSIVEYRCTMPAVNAEVFPATLISNYWSSSHFAGYPNGSWNINFNDGSHETCNKNWNLYLRLVRGMASSTELKQEGARK